LRYGVRIGEEGHHRRRHHEAARRHDFGEWAPLVEQREHRAREQLFHVSHEGKTLELAGIEVERVDVIEGRHLRLLKRLLEENEEAIAPFWRGGPRIDERR
jgi:hypothetical protein